jgi:hypothetical protein
VIGSKSPPTTIPQPNSFKQEGGAQGWLIQGRYRPRSLKVKLNPTLGRDNLQNTPHRPQAIGHRVHVPVSHAVRLERRSNAATGVCSMVCSDEIRGTLRYHVTRGFVTDKYRYACLSCLIHEIQKLNITQNIPVDRTHWQHLHMSRRNRAWSSCAQTWVLHDVDCRKRSFPAGTIRAPLASCVQARREAAGDGGDQPRSGAARQQRGEAMGDGVRVPTPFPAPPLSPCRLLHHHQSLHP